MCYVFLLAIFALITVESGSMVVMILLMLGLTGVVFGSFINAFVWRLHEQEELKDHKPKNYKQRLKKLSISKGRSMCPGCGHQLHAKDLIPVVSWTLLGGKCRYCKKPISVQYPLIELLTGFLFALSYASWQYSLQTWPAVVAFLLWLVILVGFIAHSIYDARWYLLLDKVTAPLTAVGVGFIAAQAFALGDTSFAIEAAAGALAIGGLFLALFYASNGAWIGGGDVKLAPLLGLLAGGLLESMLLLFVASSLGVIYAGIQAVLTRKPLHMASRVPFGPFLITATIIVVLFGQTTIDWYTSIITIN